MQQFTVKIRAGRVGQEPNLMSHNLRCRENRLSTRDGSLERTSIARFAAALRRVEDTMGIYDSYITREAWYL